ncbi:hypothetical protein BDV36DRAFT_142852 [Aspergillus pseudocaelatus]|uniref:Secreted protein n=1 Tax=Aspergillus pseudocaelatus TaxID=1825620 RepID=A0ABQ6WPK9_9EURO|nr:hypothetical protein BDV36DRAFT_142852 [Aspergillus pseudocaelatus]
MASPLALLALAMETQPTSRKATLLSVDPSCQIVFPLVRIPRPWVNGWSGLSPLAQDHLGLGFENRVRGPFLPLRYPFEGCAWPLTFLACLTHGLTCGECRGWS